MSKELIRLIIMKLVEILLGIFAIKSAKNNNKGVKKRGRKKVPVDKDGKS